MWMCLQGEIFWHMSVKRPSQRCTSGNKSCTENSFPASSPKTFDFWHFETTEHPHIPCGHKKPRLPSFSERLKKYVPPKLACNAVDCTNRHRTERLNWFTTKRVFVRNSEEQLPNITSFCREKDCLKCRGTILNTTSLSAQHKGHIQNCVI